MRPSKIREQPILRVPHSKGPQQGGRMMLMLICDKCGKSYPEKQCSYYFDDRELLSIICFDCQSSS